jgi:hypothetical protein
MPDVQNSQGGAAKAPAIPSMDVTPPPPATVRDIGKQARDVARQVSAAAQQARNQAQSAPKIATVPGQATTSFPPAPPFNNDYIPQQAVDIATSFFVMVAVCVVGFPLARAFGRLIDRKAQVKSMPSADLTPQIRQLQDSVDAMAIELERISEGQRFTAKLLADRSGSSAQ